jgi:hypothetical protein
LALLSPDPPEAPKSTNLRSSGQDSIILGRLRVATWGAFYLIKRAKTVLRGGYSHTIETPINENLAVSSSSGAGGLASNPFNGSAGQQPIALVMECGGMCESTSRNQATGSTRAACRKR